MCDIILKKRNGKKLSSKEINFFIKGYVKGDIPDYQISALLMAIYFQGLDKKETVYLVKAMINSGDTITLSRIKGIIVDKHSTGGVGDKTSLVLAPMVVACGAKVAKLSGRGLGHTGGTIDKLESFKGFTTEIDEAKFISIVNKTGLAIGSQTQNLVPADKKLYALRDVTATVDNMSLIAGSIMSKKLASGAHAIVLDVKTGEGAFMKETDKAFELAQTMVNIGEAMGKKTVAIVSDMSQPLGNAIGNSLEVIEAIDTLKGKGPKDLLELSLELGSHMLVLSRITNDHEKAKTMLLESIRSGKALNKFKEFIEAQGGDITQLENTSKLPKAKYQLDLISKADGFIKEINAENVGIASLLSGAGRETKESPIDLGAGIYLHKKTGNFINKGERIATVYANNKDKLEPACQKLLSAFSFSSTQTPVKKLLIGMVAKDKESRF